MKKVKNIINPIVLWKLNEYLDLNIKVVKNLDHCDIIIGIKEIKINNISATST